MKETNQYRDVRWQKRRLETLERCGWACVMCGASNDASLHVHHKRYEKNAPIWEAEDRDLTVLCDGCHEKVTELKANIGACLHHPIIFEAFSAFLETVYADFNAGRLHDGDLCALTALARKLTFGSRDRIPNSGALMPEQQNAQG